MDLNPRLLTELNALVRLDPPDALMPRINCSLTAGQLARAALRTPSCGPLEAAHAAFVEAVAEDPSLSDIKVVDYRNRNDISGFVGYAFRDDAGAVVVAFRGSESTSSCAESNIDWIDNVRAPFDGSVQYPDVEAFIQRYAAERVCFTGHSKGAHNALYALAVSENPRARAVCFDGQGFAPGQLSRAQKDRLHVRAVNYVQVRDIVGALLCHPERRVFVKATGEHHPHAPESMLFDAEGWPVRGKRSLASRAAGLLTCAGFPFIEKGVREVEAVGRALRDVGR